MIVSIMEAMGMALEAEFGDGYKACMEEMPQDMQGGRFFIQCLNPANTRFRGRRYFRRSRFCVQYFPLSEQDRNRECHDVGERLFSCLEYLEVDESLIRGTKMEYEVADGKLRFFVNYDFFVYTEDTTVPAMEEVASKTCVKG